MTARLEFVRVLVRDVPRAIGFYRDTLGLTLAFDDGENYAAFDVVDGFGLSLFRHDLMVEAVGGPGVSPDPAGDRAALVFAVDDVDREADRLRGLGVELVTEPEDRPDWGIRTLHLRDPDGNLVELNAPLGDA